jgi:hypothetical protein
MTRQHWPDWTAQDELILANQEVRRLNKLFIAADEDGKNALWPELNAANAEQHKWEMAVANQKEAKKR